jgi:hypothetical protein
MYIRILTREIMAELQNSVKLCTLGNMSYVQHRAISFFIVYENKSRFQYLKINSSKFLGGD